MYIEWGREPLDRKLEPCLLSTRCGGSNQNRWKQPLGLAFKVNAAGEVVYVLPTDDEILRDVADALKHLLSDCSLTHEATIGIHTRHRAGKQFMIEIELKWAWSCTREFLAQ